MNGDMNEVFEDLNKVWGCVFGDLYDGGYLQKGLVIEDGRIVGAE